MLKEKIKNGEKTIGMFVHLSDVTSGRIAGLAGYDYVWIDMEHSYLSYETLLHLIIAVKSGGGQVIVRAPQDDLTATKKILELGVDGIIFPMIKTAGDANRVISYTLYPPYGVRGFGPLNAADYGFKDVNEYIESSRDDMCRFVQIEHIDAVRNLDEIIKNDFIDGYIVGANDLSGSIGKLGQSYCEETTALIREVIEKLHAAGKYVAIATGDFSEAALQHWHDLGFDSICSGADYELLREAVKQNRATLEKIHRK